MNIKDNFTGVQHIGMPTNDLNATLDFYEKIVFEVALRTYNETAKEEVAFMKLGDLTLEIFESGKAPLIAGAIDHIAINVKSIGEAYKYICENGLNNTNDEIHFLPFWNNGVKYFIIEGPSKERIEFSQYL